MKARELAPVLLLLVLLGPIRAQISKPLANDKTIDDNVKSNVFLSRQASDDLLGYPNLDEEALANSQCPRHVELRWQAEVSASIYAAPVIADINGDGKLDVVVPSFVHYLDVLEGADGEKMPGWPAFHQALVHSSPLIYDIDKDGSKEVLLPTYAGEILIFRSSGFNSGEKLIVPKLKVRRDWYVGLEPDHVDRSRPDVHDDGLASAATEHVRNMSKDVISGNTSSDPDSAPGSVNSSANSPANASETASRKPETNSTGAGNNTAVKQLVGDSSDEGDASGFHVAAASLNGSQLESTGGNGSQHESTRRRLMQATAEDQQEPLERDAEASFDVFRDQGEDGLSDEYNYDYDDYLDESMWGDDHWRVYEKEEDFIHVDAHILCTPVIADIDKDGINELIVAASFFFDREHYEDPAHAAELGKDVDIGKYVAGAIVVFNTETKQVKWQQHLDLSTDSVSFRAYIYSAPTVVDLDGEGYLSILVGTSFGFVYALHHNGSVRANFPLQMGEIHAQVVAADINDDGKVEIVTGDTRGNVAAWAPTGKLLWEVHLKSLIGPAPTVGDVNGDGNTEIVVPTASGNIYVLRGKDGSYVAPFPFRTHGRVMSSVLLVDFGGREASGPGALTLVATSFDGYLYIIDGNSGCADSIDIGETSYTMVLAENIDGGDDLDLVVATMNGNVYCFQTPVTHHPLKAWPALSHGRNLFSPRYNREGIYALPSSRAFRDEAGRSFWVLFKIVDQQSMQGPYNVTVTLSTPGNYKGERRVTHSRVYEQPGVEKVELPCATTRTAGTVSLEMVDKHGLHFADEFSLTFHMHYYRLLKWFIFLPMLGMLAALVGLESGDESGLPSFSNARHLS